MISADTLMELVFPGDVPHELIRKVPLIESEIQKFVTRIESLTNADATKRIPVCQPNRRRDTSKKINDIIRSVKGAGKPWQDAIEPLNAAGLYPSKDGIRKRYYQMEVQPMSPEQERRLPDGPVDFADFMPIQARTFSSTEAAQRCATLQESKGKQQDPVAVEESKIEESRGQKVEVGGVQDMPESSPQSQPHTDDAVVELIWAEVQKGTGMRDISGILASQGIMVPWQQVRSIYALEKKRRSKLKLGAPVQPSEVQPQPTPVRPHRDSVSERRDQSKSEPVRTGSEAPIYKPAEIDGPIWDMHIKGMTPDEILEEMNSRGYLLNPGSIERRLTKMGANLEG